MADFYFYMAPSQIVLFKPLQFIIEKLLEYYYIHFRLYKTLLRIWYYYQLVY